MKTFIAKNIENKKWYVIDAQWITLWKIAAKIAPILRWKDKPNFSPHMDNGAFVVITNCDKFILTWNKMQAKNYYSHSRYAKDGLKTIPAERMIVKDPTFMMQHAIAWMIPNNKLKKLILMKLKLFAWDTHTHEAQKPEALII